MVLSTHAIDSAATASEAEARLRSILNTTAIGIVVIDEHGSIEEFNPACVNLFGYSKEETFGHNVTLLMPEPYCTEHDNYIKNYLSTGCSRIIGVGREVLARHKNGQCFPAELLVSKAELNQRCVFIGFIKDITERSERETAMRESEERFRQLAANVNVMFWLSEPDKDKLLYVNTAFETIWGRSCASLYQNPYAVWLESIHPDDRERVLNDGFSGRLDQAQSQRYRIKRPDGSIRWIEDRLFPIRDQSGKVYRIAGIAEDVTLHIESEQELRIAATAFETREGTLITDANEVIIRVNRAFTEITGYHAEEAIGKRPSILKSGRHDADFYQRMRMQLQAAGHWQGEIWDRHKDGHIYPKSLTITAVQDRQGNVTHYVGNFSDISERKEAEEKIRNLAFYDSLTLLPNRRLLADRLEQALVASVRSGEYGALFFLDLDNFKNLNDTKGHQYGDKLLVDVAERLRLCVREEDTVARLGGDEFVVMLETLGLSAEHAAVAALAIGEKILYQLNQPYPIDGYTHHSSSSIGVTLFYGKNHRPDELLVQADTAMYESKKAGRNTLRFFDPSMQQTLTRRVSLEHALRQAVAEEQFRVYYQIQVDEHRQPVGVEALIRWKHPEQGMMSPADFIPLAEETGLIHPVGRYVLIQVCEQLQRWHERAGFNNLSVSVNVSAIQFNKADFVDQIKDTIEHYRFDRNLLKLELTEMMVLGDIAVATHKMAQLRAIGLQISMDDFGTGYSSLNYLKRLPFNQVKIDRRFTGNVLEDAEDAFIIEMIVELSRRLSMETLAEGIETQAQLELLHRLGCRRFQGYLFGHPIAGSELERQLSRTFAV